MILRVKLFLYQRVKKSWIWVNIIIIIHIQRISVWPTLGWYWDHFFPVDSPLLTHPSRLRLFRLWHLCSDLPWPGQSMATTKKPCSASAGATLSEFEGHDLLRIIEKQFGWKHIYICKYIIQVCIIYNIQDIYMNIRSIFDSFINTTNYLIISPHGKWLIHSFTKTEPSYYVFICRYVSVINDNYRGSWFDVVVTLWKTCQIRWPIHWEWRWNKWRLHLLVILIHLEGIVIHPSIDDLFIGNESIFSGIYYFQYLRK